MLRPGLIAAALVFVLHALAPAAAAAHSPEACLDEAARSLAGGAVKRTFRPAPLARQNDLSADARGLVWHPRQPRRGIGRARYAIAFDGSDNCWIGGRMVGTGKSSGTAPSAMALGTGYATRGTEVYLLEIGRALNGVWVGRQADGVRLQNLLFSELEGTCVIADHQGDLTIDNVFFHNCARVVHLASRSPGSSLTIQDSLILIDSADRRTRGRLFSGRSLESEAVVHFTGNLVATAAALDARSLSLIEPHCSDNTLIWLGEGHYPGALPDCFTVVEDRAAWAAARVAWMTQHALRLAGLSGQTDPVPAACSIPAVPQSIAPRRTVGSGTPGSCSEAALRSALAGGGTVVFACGAAPVTIPISSQLVVARPTVIDGGGRVALDGRNRTRILRNDSELTLRRITLARGWADVVCSGSPDGGGAVNSTYGHRLNLVDSTFTGNRTTAQGFGGAIFQAGNGMLTVVRSRFEGNAGGGGGAIYSLLAGLRVVGSSFLRNQGTSGWQGGGGIMTDGASAGSGSGRSGGEISVCGSTFNANSALATGGGAYLYAYDRDRVSVGHSTFTGNRALANSGGVSMGGGLRLGAATVVVEASEFRENEARTGGAIATNGGTRTRVAGSTFACNSSDIAGGARSDGNDMQACR